MENFSCSSHWPPCHILILSTSIAASILQTSPWLPSLIICTHQAHIYTHSLTHFDRCSKIFPVLCHLCFLKFCQLSSALHHSSSGSSSIAMECDQGTQRSLCTTEKASGLIAVSDTSSCKDESFLIYILDTSSCKDESFLIYVLLQPTECFLRKPKETKEEAQKTRKWKKVPATVCHSGVDTCDFHDIFIYHTYVKLFWPPTKRSRNFKSRWDLLTFLWCWGRNFLWGTKIKLFWLPFHSCERPTAFLPAGFSL